MRIAIISDIHGNFQALEAVLNDINRSNVQSIICLGDVISLGIQPREVIRHLQEMDNCKFVMGNHDVPLINYAQLVMLCMVSMDTFTSNKWTLSQISENDLDFIRTFETSFKLEAPDGRDILFFHGTPRCNHKGIHPDFSEDEVNKILRGHTETIFVCGHTHKQMMRKFQGGLIVNPGSVGSVFDENFAKGEEPVLRPWAEYGILELSTTDVFFEMKRVNFDIQAIRAVIAHSDIPYREWWEKQYC